METLKIINPKGISEEEAHKLKPRLAARGVVFDEYKNFAILPVTKVNYYKLPGGGIEGDENKIQAFRRECLEEIGFDVEVIEELGIVIEYRTEVSVIQTSYCYLAKVTGKKQKVAFTEDEVNQGFAEAKWLPFEEAFKLVSSSEPIEWEGHFIKERDTLLLETAKKYLI